MTVRCICECSEDVQTCFWFCVDVLYVLSERQSSVVSHSKCSGVAGLWDQLTVQHDGRSSCVFVVPWDDECEYGFCCGVTFLVCVCIVVDVVKRL